MKRKSVKGTYPAELVFEQTAFDRWQGKLLTARNVVDLENEYRQVRRQPLCWIEQVHEGSWTRKGEVGGDYRVTKQAGDKNSRRYSDHASLNDAQRACSRWAGRRFRIVPE